MTPFLIGIDLGTTNSALAFVDTRARRPRAALFRVPQAVEPSLVEPRSVLPSFLYFVEPHEAASMALPWDPQPAAIAGVLARERGALAPSRQISSAKSWLAHPGVDRRAPILPAVEADIRLSPLDASARYLMHLRDAWNSDVAGSDAALRLERQAILVTVPASFDEEARELTVEAARLAGFADVRLIEEPIAAFYAWIAEHRTSAARALSLEPGGPGRLALVCDVGGGTTDFSLIRVGLDGTGPAFERMAIGDHLLLGGDNMDLALAALVDERAVATRPGMRLAITQRSALRRVCSAAKEQLLGDDPPDRVPVTVLGAGRSVVGDSVTVDLTREDVERTLAGFLPLAGPGDAPAARDRRAGLRELGLPYETDTAITRHLAAFLARAAAASSDLGASLVTIGGRTLARPDYVLFNGGFFAPRAARDRVVRTLETWFGAAPRVLATGSLEAAVALGAATYGRLRAGVGASLSLVKAGSGRAYYIVLGGGSDETAAVCVLARGTEEGTHATIPHQFTLATNRPVSFALRSSTVRSDRIGDIVRLDDGGNFQEHTPLVTVLRYGRKSRQVDLPVRLSMTFTEVGTLDLACESQASEHRWRLQFSARNPDQLEDVEDAGAGGSREADALVADEAIAAAEQAIGEVFGGAIGGSDVSAESLVASLEKTTGFAKGSWPLVVTRRLADALLAVADGRRQSAPLEARWLNLFGFCVRPGFGAAKDPWRIGEARKVYAGGVLFPGSIQNRVEWLVLWQRAAGGFSAGQQRELAQRVMGEIGLSGRKTTGRLNPQLERESWRLLASLERIDAVTRVRIGDELLRRLRRDPANVSLLWAAGRLGARVPLYGPLTSVVPPADATRWLEALAALRQTTPELAAAIVQTAALTGDALRDVDDAARSAVRARLAEAGFEDAALRPLTEVVAASAADTSRVFGEPLPEGLRLDRGDA